LREKVARRFSKNVSIQIKLVGIERRLLTLEEPERAQDRVEGTWGYCGFLIE
jgi:hypothetical protein